MSLIRCSVSAVQRNFRRLSTDSTFPSPAFWVGINDLAMTKLEDIPTVVTSLIQQLEALWMIGARDFLFIDLPPLERAPGCASSPVSFPPTLSNQQLYPEVVP